MRADEIAAWRGEERKKLAEETEVGHRWELYWLSDPPDEGGKEKIEKAALHYASESGAKFLGITGSHWEGGKHGDTGWFRYTVEFEATEEYIRRLQDG